MSIPRQQPVLLAFAVAKQSHPKKSPQMRRVSVQQQYDARTTLGWKRCVREGRGGRTRSGSGEGGKGGGRRRGNIGWEKTRRNVVSGVSGVCECACVLCFVFVFSGCACSCDVCVCVHVHVLCVCSCGVCVHAVCVHVVCVCVFMWWWCVLVFVWCGCVCVHVVCAHHDVGIIFDKLADFQLGTKSFRLSPTREQNTRMKIS